MSRFASTEPTETASRVTTNSAVATRATQLPSHFRDERAFFPFSTAPSIALLGGRLFYCLPHDIRRRIVAGFAPQMFRDLEQFRAGTRPAHTRFSRSTGCAASSSTSRRPRASPSAVASSAGWLAATRTSASTSSPFSAS